MKCKVDILAVMSSGACLWYIFYVYLYRLVSHGWMEVWSVGWGRWKWWRWREHFLGKLI